MTPVALEVIVALAGVIVSMLCSAFVAGISVGQMKSDMRSIADRLAKIEGMFTLRLKDGQ